MTWWRCSLMATLANPDNNWSDIQRSPNTVNYVSSITWLHTESCASNVTHGICAVLQFEYCTVYSNIFHCEIFHQKWFHSFMCHYDFSSLRIKKVRGQKSTQGYAHFRFIAYKSPLVVWEVLWVIFMIHDIFSSLEYYITSLKRWNRS